MKVIWNPFLKLANLRMPKMGRNQSLRKFPPKFNNLLALEKNWNNAKNLGKFKKELELKIRIMETQP